MGVVRSEYRVRWQREGMPVRSKVFQVAKAARAFADRLSDEWGPIVMVTLERRDVGPWSEVDS